MKNNVDRKLFNVLATHPLQAYEWGEFREKTGVKVVRKIIHDKNAFQLTIHNIPHTPWKIGYLPKGTLPAKEMIDELVKIGKEENCIFIQLEPNVLVSTSEVADSPADSAFVATPAKEAALAKRGWTPRRWKTLNLQLSFHPLFTKYTFVLDITKSEDELLKSFHPKTRYNIKVAQKHGVEVIEDNSDEAFEKYLKLIQKTTRRQKFYAHNETYHKLMWQTLKAANGKWQMANRNELKAHLLIAKYHPPSAISHTPLAAWVLFGFHDILYYPYGASSSEHREFMASNLLMWEAIRFGKKLGLKKFDMWGALGPEPDKNDPWYGFHRFKEGYGTKLVEFVGSYDLIINPTLYQLYKAADVIRWSLLKLKYSL